MKTIVLDHIHPNFPEHPAKIPLGASSVRVSDSVATEGYTCRCILCVTSKTAKREFEFTPVQENDILFRKEDLFYIEGFEKYQLGIKPLPLPGQKVTFEFEFLGLQYEGKNGSVQRTNELTISKSVWDVLKKANATGEPITVTNFFQGNTPWIHNFFGKRYQVLSLHHNGEVFSRALFVPPAEAQGENIEPYQIMVKSLTGVPVKLQPEGADIVSIHTFVWILNE